MNPITAVAVIWCALALAALGGIYMTGNPWCLAIMLLALLLEGKHESKG